MKRRTRRAAAALLAVWLLFSLSLPAALGAEGSSGEEIAIHNLEDFLAFAEQCSLDTWSQGKTAVLQTDLNLAGKDFAPIPTFGGVFEGNGHTISGLSITEAGSSMGLFRFLQKGAVLRNLNVTGRVAPAGSAVNVGGLVGSSSGSVQNCGFQGTVEGNTNTGGLVGRNTISGEISGCSVSGNVTGETCTGGICGRSLGSVLKCENAAQVNTSDPGPGTSTSDVSSALDRLTSPETEEERAGILASHMDTGGIVGYSAGIVSACTNSGAVGYSHVGYNVGGIAGRQAGYLTGCSNSALICGRKDVGGIVGQAEPDILLNTDGDTLATLRGQLTDLEDLVDRALSHTDASRSDISSRLSAIGSSTEGAKESARTLLDHLTDFTDTNLDTINTFSSAIIGALDGLDPAWESFSTASSHLGETADRLENAIQALGDSRHLADDIVAQARQTVETLRTLGPELEDAAAFVQEASRSLQDAVILHDETAIHAAIRSLSSGIQDLGSSLQHAQGALDSLHVALSNLLAALERPQDPGSGTDPGAGGTDPGTGGETDPGTGGTDPGTGGETDPGTGETEPGTGGETDPGTGGETDPGAGGGTDPGTGGETDPGTGGGTDPGTGGETDPGTGGGTDPGTGGGILPGLDFPWSGSGSLLPEWSPEARAQMQAAVDSIRQIGTSLHSAGSALHQMGSAIHTLLDNVELDWSAVQDALQGVDGSMGSLTDAIHSMDDVLEELNQTFSTVNPLTEALGDVANQLADTASAGGAVTEDLKAAVDTLRDVTAKLSQDGDVSLTPLGEPVREAADGLFASLSVLSGSMSSLKGSVDGAGDQLSADLQAISHQISRILVGMVDTLDSAQTVTDPESLYGDFSETDYESTRLGKVADSVNTGAIEGDRNTGGIAGAVGVDYSLDPEDDTPRISFGSTYELRVVLLNSRNYGDITGKRDCVGGAAGRMDMGAAVGCQSYCQVTSTGSGYVGGIAGSADASVRRCWARCSLSGSEYVGGIAGWAVRLTDCRAVTTIRAGTEFVGSIAGGADLETGEVRGNRFVPAGAAGIDGVSYSGVAEPASLEEIEAEAGTPAEFLSFTLTLRAGDTVVEQIPFQYGADLSALALPQVPEQEGSYGRWPSLQGADSRSDLVVDAVYTPWVTLVSSAEMDGKRSLALAEGQFTEEGSLHVTDSPETPPRGGEHLDVWTLTLDGAEETGSVPVRLLNRSGQRCTVWRLEGSRWVEQKAETNGSYLLVSMEGTSGTFCVEPTMETLPVPLPVLAGAGGGAMLLVILLLALRHRKKRRARKREAERKKKAEEPVVPDLPPEPPVPSEEDRPEENPEVSPEPDSGIFRKKAGTGATVPSSDSDQGDP